MRRILLPMATIAASLLLLAVASAPRASGRAEEIPVGSFRATVEEIAKGDDVQVSHVVIEVRPGSMVRLVCDQPNRGGGSCRAADAKGAISIVKLSVLGFQMTCDGKDVLKFRVGIASGGGSAVFSETTSSNSTKKLADILSIPLKTGVYREGESVPAIKFDGRSFNIVVDAPKP